MAAILMALASAAIWGGADFVAGLKSRTSSVLAVLGVSQLAGLAVMGVVLAVTLEAPPPGRYLVYGALAGGASAIGLAALYRGLAIGAMSVVAPITATGVTIPVVVGVARGEDPTGIQVGGFLLAIGGVVLASREPSTTDLGRRALASGVGLALLGALGFGSFFTAFDAASEGSVVWALALQRSTLVALLVAGALAARPRLSLRRQDIRPVIAVGLLDLAAVALFAEASTRGLLSVVSVIASLYPITTVLLAHLLLRERIGGTQRAGVLGALAGIGLVTAG